MRWNLVKGYETIATLTRVLQMDLLDAQRTLVISRNGSVVSLQAVSLP